MVLTAGRGESPQAARALDELCRIYWYPLYAYVRRCGHEAHEAEDLTQEFFARLLAKNYLADVQREKGKFRSFLLASLKHFLANEWDRAHTAKRGGQNAHLSLDAAETRYRAEPVDELKPFLTAGKDVTHYADVADSPRRDRESGYTVVYVPCRWQRNRLDAKVVFGADGKISGLWMVAPQTMSSRTFSLRHRPASEMADDLRQILLGHPGQEATPATNNLELTVTAPPDVLGRVTTFIAAKDWPDGITRGPECHYRRDNVENAARSFFYACSIEDYDCIANMLSVDLLAKLKGTKLPPFGSAVDPKLIDELRADWPGKEAAMRKLAEAWNKYPLRQLREEPVIAMAFGDRYFASVAFEGGPQDVVQLDFTHDRNGTYTNALVIDTFPPWLPAK